MLPKDVCSMLSFCALLHAYTTKQKLKVSSLCFFFLASKNKKKKIISFAFFLVRNKSYCERCTKALTSCWCSTIHGRKSFFVEIIVFFVEKKTLVRLWQFETKKETKTKVMVSKSFIWPKKNESSFGLKKKLFLCGCGCLL